MSVLSQCMSIIQLTSLDWSWEERFSMVGHSFRVMAMAKNFDELVVGMMHAIYAGSDYTRFLYRVDVDGDPEWKAALDLFVPPLKMKGQPERTRDSSRERARMAFSTRGVSDTPGICCCAC